jgi:uncharacterized protein (UPF0333 family)
MIAKANGKAPTDRHDVTHTQTVSGPTIDNRNQLSTPVMLGFLIVVAAMCIGLTVVGIQSGYASAAAQQAERNAKLAQYQLEEEIKKLEERSK